MTNKSSHSSDSSSDKSDDDLGQPAPSSSENNSPDTSSVQIDQDESKASRKKASTKEESTKSEPWVSEDTFTHIFDRISDVTSSAFKLAKKTTGTSYKVGKAIIQSQDQLKLMVAAGQSLKDLREVAGLTVSELSDAINLKDKTLLEAVEDGTATLSFELILRLSALLARNDPIPFILKYSRTYSPETWKILNDWGAGRLPLQYQREREFINIYRSQDQARQLSDEGYNRVLEFTRHAFNLSLHFIAEQETKVADAKESLREEIRQEILAEMATANSEAEASPHKPSENSSESGNATSPKK